MNLVVAAITLRALLGRRRALLLLLLPIPLVVLAVALRLSGVSPEAAATVLLQRYGLGTLVPLLALIAASGVLGSEIDDGTILFLLAKPISRPSIVNAKLAVAIGVTVLFAVAPVLVAGLVLVGTEDGLSAGFAAGALAGCVAYCAIFVLINVISRHAVVVGLIYVLIWESLIGGFVPGVRQLSVQQWSLSIAQAISSYPGLVADVRLPAALILLVAVTAGATAIAGQRLRSLSIAGET